MGVELLYNSVKTEVKLQFQLETELETSCGRESHTRPKGLGTLMNSSPEKMLIRCSKESHHPAESWAAGPPVEHQENKKDTMLTAIRVGVKMLQLCSVSNSLSQWNPTQPFQTLQIKSEVQYFFKEGFLHASLSLRQ